ncbi:sensor domain-containing diguanylate cyclase [Rhizobium halophytocola]|uniref:diguanylate cyclase n=1 Tax=Rhizobium halophytocola TaxID=735519 RepID=A0ABS4E5V2_9HYPH|nr:sensor domain-containing diguanylate cyclase [Rhizobium halophytocola]MBP1853279.1 diguanylate cyclase (GGDEF)-like protein/PAS domain S-box-containing protein [Rhizobium halophytocola]
MPSWRRDHRGPEFHLSLALAALVGLLVFVAALGGITLTRDTGQIASIWLANAIVLAILLKTRRSSWPYLLAAAYLGNMLAGLGAGAGLMTAVGLSLCNTLEVLICAALITTATKERDFRRPMPMLLLSVIAIGPAGLMSAALAGSVLSLIGGADMLKIAITWYPAHVLGLVTLAPLLLVLGEQDLKDLAHPRFLLRTLLVLAAVGAILALIFLQKSMPLLFFAFPAIILATFCLGFLGAAMSVVLTASIAVWGTFHGLGPISLMADPAASKVLALQLFTGTSALTGFAVACMLGERAILMAALEQTPDFYFIKNTESEFVSVNRNVVRHNGFAHGRQMLGKTDAELTTPKRAETLLLEEWSVMHGGLPVNNRVECIPDETGAARWYETSKVALKSMTGRVIGLAGVTREITQRKQMEAELEEGRDQLALIMNEMSDGIVTIDPDDRIVYCNAKYRNLYPITGKYRLPGAFMPSVLALAKEAGELPGLSPSEAMRKLKAGIDDEFEMFDGTWLHARSRIGSRGYVTLVVSDITKLKRSLIELRGMAEKLEVLADTDGLTGLLNRRSLDQRLDQEILRCRRSRQPVSMILLDVDRFKAYNDLYGHQGGDECLKRVAQVLAQSVKRPSDFVARYGGEEFCIVLPDTDQAGAFVLAEQVRQAVSGRKMKHEGSEKSVVTVSAGVASLMHDGNASTSVALVSRADTALYEAKDAGRDRVACWNPISDISAPEAARMLK